MADVFISYAREDQAYVRSLHDALTSAARDVWVDWSGPTPTANWLSEVGAAIEGAKTFLAVISPDFAASEWCHAELKQAVAMGKRVIPVVYREVPASELPAPLRNIQWLSLPNLDANAVDVLINALEVDLEWVSSHTTLLARAIEWERSSRSAGLLFRGDALRRAEDQLAKVARDKTPQPTPLQREYLLASRQAAARGQWRAMAILAGAVLVLAAASGFAFFQMNQANTNEARAVRQSEISLSRSLASQASEAMAIQPSSMQTALLLAIESMRREPSVRASSLIGQILPLLRSLSMSAQHGEPISAIALSADGRYLATAGTFTARIWEARSGRQVTTVKHQGKINSVAFSPDGRLFATGSSDATASVWETQTGREVTRRTHGDPVFAVVFSPDGALIASASGLANVGEIDVEAAHDGSVRIWNPATGEEVTRLTHGDSVYAVAFSPSGSLVATASRDGTARLWRIDGTEVVRSETDNDVISVAFSPDGRLLGMGSVNGTVQLLNTATGKEDVTLHVGETVGILKFSPDGKYLVTADGGDSRSVTHTALVWSLEPRNPFIVDTNPALQGDVVAELPYEDTVEALAFSPDGHYIAYGGGLRLHETSVKVWDNITNREVARLPHESQVFDLAFTPDGTGLATGSADGWARIWGSRPVKWCKSECVILADGRLRRQWRDARRSPPLVGIVGVGGPAA